MQVMQHRIGKATLILMLSVAAGCSETLTSPISEGNDTSKVTEPAKATTVSFRQFLADANARRRDPAFRSSYDVDTALVAGANERMQRGDSSLRAVLFEPEWEAVRRSRFVQTSNDELPVELPTEDGVTEAELANYPGNLKPFARVISAATTPRFDAAPHITGTPRVTLVATATVFGTHAINEATINVTGRHTTSGKLNAKSEMTDEALNCLSYLGDPHNFISFIRCSFTGHVTNSDVSIPLEYNNNGDITRFHCGITATTQGTHGAYFLAPTFSVGSDGKLSPGDFVRFGETFGYGSTVKTVPQGACQQPEIELKLYADGKSASNGDSITTTPGPQSFDLIVHEYLLGGWFRWTVNSAEAPATGHFWQDTYGPGKYVFRVIHTTSQELADTASVTLIIPRPQSPQPPPPPTPEEPCPPGYYSAGALCYPDGYGGGGGGGGGGANSPEDMCDPGYTWNGSECAPTDEDPPTSQLPTGGSTEPGGGGGDVCYYMWYFVWYLDVWIPDYDLLCGL